MLQINQKHIITDYRPYCEYIYIYIFYYMLYALECLESLAIALLYQYFLYITKKNMFVSINSFAL